MGEASKGASTMRADANALAARRTLVDLARARGSALLARQAEPHDELLSLLWCVRFDRAHALRLIAQADAQQRAHLSGDLLAAADLFDHLDGASQAHLRSLVARHGRLAHAPQ